MTDQELKDLVASMVATVADAGAYIHETGTYLRDTCTYLHETGAQIRETDAVLRNTGAHIRETGAVLRETGAYIHETGAFIHETGAHIRETGAYIKQTDAQLRELKVQMGGLSDKFGSFTEGLALPSMARILKQRFHMDIVMPGLSVELKDGRHLEVDVLATSNSGRDEVYVVEVKSRLRQKAIAQIKRTIHELPEFLPHLRGRKVYGILAAVDAPQQIGEQVLREGIYLARIHDEEFELQVPADFQPRAF